AALDAGGGDEARAFLGGIAMPLLASRAPMPEKLVYTIAPGDSLSKIAAKFNTPVTLIRKANGLAGEGIRTGYDLTLLDGNNHVFSLTVSRKENFMDLMLDGKFFKRYRVGTGVNNSTPLGTFKIVDKLEHPPWWRGDGTVVPYTGEPGENLLGTHWLAWDRPGFGIHGTWEPETVGSQSSAGCVRLKNEDVEELFTILPRGTLVTVGD
ncbi:MAG: L,D-transpeptidase family protein, partial [Kiritimatiellae bacterium]|nr:L,D-transpeptidase family protein [Kiritimatiellia bacterium]